MSILLEAIGEILRPALVQRGPGPIRLEEADAGSKCGPITLRKRVDAVALRPDQIGGRACPRADCALGFSASDRLHPLFRLDVAGLTVLCDYILFCDETPAPDARLFVFLCELKSGRVDGSRQQIEKGRLLADHIIATARHHRGLRTPPRVVHRGLVFTAGRPVPMGSLRHVRCAYPETMPDALFEEMPFAYYASGTEYPLEHFFA
jgi:hypothetical protein